MKKMRITALSLIFALCVTCIPAESGAVSKSTYARNTVNQWENNYSAYSQGCYVGGSTFYYSKMNVLYKYNLKSKKRTRVYKFNDAFTISSILNHKNYLYVVINKFFGTGGYYPYIVRVKTDGTGMKQLDVGENLSIAGGKLYYIKKTPLDDFETYDAVGVYSMKPNGSAKTCIIENDIVKSAVCDGKNIYYTDLYGSFQTDLTGRNQKQVANKNATLSGVYKNILYYTVPGENGDTLYQRNLKTNKVSQVAKKIEGSTARVDVYSGNLYYVSYTEYGKKAKVYQANVKTKTKKVILQQKGIYYLNTFGPYISYAANSGNVEKNIVSRVMNVKTKKKQRLCTYYVS